MIRTGLIWSGILIIAMLVISAYGQLIIPSDAEIAIHWGIGGEPNRFADKTFALWLIPGMALVISLILAIIPLVEPRRKHLLQSSGLYIRAWVGSMMVVTLAHGVVVLSALGMNLPVTQLVLAAVGIFLALIGNILGKSQSNFFIGFKTPWTLSSDLSWDKTHRLAGRLWVMGGLVIAVLAFIAEPTHVVQVTVSIVAIMMVVPLVASYLYWRGDKSRKTNDA